MADAAAAQVIEIARVYPAPREAVWAAWTDPAQIARWWGKRGWSTPPDSVAIELRPGGVFRLDSVSDADGTVMRHDGTFRVVEPPARLEFATDDSVATVTFADVGAGRTEMVFRVELAVTDATRARAEVGLGSAFDRLGEQLAGWMDYRLEVVVVPVADVDRAKAFYAGVLGFAVDHDAEPGAGSAWSSSPRAARAARSRSAPASRDGPARWTASSSSSATSTRHARSWSRAASI